MQWRPIILLIAGIIVILAVHVLQDIPYPHPKKILVSQYEPTAPMYDEVILTPVGSFLYMTTFWYEQPKESVQYVGISPLKIGVQGRVRQLKKPISSLLKSTDDEWTECFDHELRGHISKVSYRKGELDEARMSHFSVLYHVVEDDVPIHYARVYYTHDSLFYYKDIRLPGSTWIEALSLEKNNLLFTRNPDNYQVRMITLDPHLLDPPHSEHAEEIVYLESEHGKQVEKWYQPTLTEQHDYVLAQLYSPNPDTYRVFSYGVQKSSNRLYITITVTDNATSTDTEWIERERGASNYTLFDETIDYVGFTDSHYYPDYINMDYMPRLSICKWALSTDAKTIVLPYIKNKLLTLDYTDKIDVLLRIEKERKHLYTNGNNSFLNEYYYWQDAEVTYADIMGVQLDNRGGRLAVWTEFNEIYLYERHPVNMNLTTSKKSHLRLLVDTLNDWVEAHLANLTEEEEVYIREYLPPKWDLSMIITPIEGQLESIPVAYALFYDHINEHGIVEQYIFIALKNGQVHSYLMDQTESTKKITFLAFVLEKWEMLMAMMMIIFIFVYNESHIYI